MFRPSFLAVTAHWISSEWVLHKSLLDFVPVQGPANAESIGHSVFEVLQEYGVVDKILGITTPEAPNTAESVRKLIELLKSDRVTNGRISNGTPLQFHSPMKISRNFLRNKKNPFYESKFQHYSLLIDYFS